MTQVDLNQFTPEQLASLEIQMKERKEKEAYRIMKERETYKKLKDEAIVTFFGQLQVISNQLIAAKKDVFEGFDSIINMKDELFKTKSDRQSDTLTTDDGKITIKLGNRVNDGWADTVDVGIIKVKEYLRTLAKDENSADLLDTIMKLISKDRKGNLKASRVLELEQLAVKRNDPTFTEGINIIKEAYRPVPTCQFIDVKYRDENGKERSLPLSMSVADELLEEKK